MLRDIQHYKDETTISLNKKIKVIELIHDKQKSMEIHSILWTSLFVNPLSIAPLDNIIFIVL